MAKDNLKTHVWPWDIPITESEAWKRLMAIEKEINIIKANSEDARKLYELVEQRNQIEESQMKEEMEYWRQKRLEELEKARNEAQGTLDAIYDD